MRFVAAVFSSVLKPAVASDLSVLSELELLKSQVGDSKTYNRVVSYPLRNSVSANLPCSHKSVLETYRS
jgi:hypothetical protein